MSVRQNVVPDIIIWFVMNCKQRFVDILIILGSLLRTCSSLLVGTLLVMYVLAGFIRLLLDGEQTSLTLSQLIDQHAIEYGWLLKLLVNCFGYACVIVPGILIYQYTKRIQYLKDGRCKYLHRGRRRHGMTRKLTDLLSIASLRSSLQTGEVLPETGRRRCAWRFAGHDPR